MKITEILNEEQLDELDFKKALAGGALALATANAPNQKFNPETPPPEPTKQVQKAAPQEDPKSVELAKKISSRYKVNQDLALNVVKLAKKYEKPYFPKQKDLLAIVGIESSFNPDAVSGLKTDPARGLTQIRPGVWGMDAEKLSGDIEQQISKSSDILAQYNKKLKNPKDAVHAYNVGLTAFLRGDLNPNYVEKFEKERQQYR